MHWRSKLGCLIVLSFLRSAPYGKVILMRVTHLSVVQRCYLQYNILRKATTAQEKHLKKSLNHVKLVFVNPPLCSRQTHTNKGWARVEIIPRVKKHIS